VAAAQTDHARWIDKMEPPYEAAVVEPEDDGIAIRGGRYAGKLQRQ
jgi:hypothetical protein